MSSNAPLPLWHKNPDWSLTSDWDSGAWQWMHGSWDLNQNLLVRHLWFSKLQNMLWADCQSAVCVLLLKSIGWSCGSSGTPCCVFGMKVRTCEACTNNSWMLATLVEALVGWGRSTVHVPVFQCMFIQVRCKWGWGQVNIGKAGLACWHIWYIIHLLRCMKSWWPVDMYQGQVVQAA